ncbi:MAG: SUMF1/EgtB/PvdO family nonheme iron enzyme, partial [Longilinea sp.]|nr:SUMF1/EgtB/PvdO family nonheme iron enzyme [Longilinea sp.]
YLVTVGQWRAFVEESGYRPTTERSLEGIANWPVISVSLFDAQAYCQWLTDKLRDWAETPAELRACLQGGGRVALPSEAQWERALRGASDRRIYPWGDEFNRDELDVRSAGPYSAVGCFAGGCSPEGLLDMVGSVWQWTRSRYQPYPYDCGDGREDEPIDDLERYVLRGGMWSIGWQDDRKRSRCSFRNSHVPSNSSTVPVFASSLLFPPEFLGAEFLKF